MGQILLLPAPCLVFTNRCLTLPSESPSPMSTDGSPPLLTSPMPRLCMEKLTFAPKWLNSMPKSLQSFQERVITRRKRKRRQRRNQSLRKMLNQSRRKPIPLRRCPREPSTWKSGRGFTPTMTNQSQSSGSGNILTMKTTPSGEEITNTMMNSPWSSCPVTSSVECSRGWTNLTKMLLLQYVCLDRTMTVPSLESGCLRVMNSHELDDNWQIDYASYNWKKLDSKSDETKKLVDQYWKWEGTDEKGRAFNQGK